MMPDKNPLVRRDLEFLPVQNGREQLILIRDHLGLVEEGKALPAQLYGFMALLDGSRTLREIQMSLMRQRGGILVDTEEVKRLLAYLDESFLLDTERYRQAREKIVSQFARRTVRPCAHSGRSYPAQAEDLKNRLDEILSSQSPVPNKLEGRVTSLIAPHIDLSVGSSVYASAYQRLTHSSPSRVIILGVGHQMEDLFSLTEKDFETPLGVVKNERSAVRKLLEAGRSLISENDFVHRSEHSVEFQVIFLQHLLARDSFTIIPILCGPLKLCLPEYTRNAYLEKTGPFLTALSEILRDKNNETLLLAGVDFSHIGPKFGHEMPATYLQSRSETHDQKLLKALSEGDANAYWKESISEMDQFNVCGFSAMACLMEVLPPFEARVLNYQVWHEQPTRSAVSFAAVVFTSPD